MLCSVSSREGICLEGSLIPSVLVDRLTGWRGLTRRSRFSISVDSAAGRRRSDALTACI